MCQNSNEYLKFKLQTAEERNELLKVQLASKNEINLNEIRGFLEPKTVRSKNIKSVKIIKVYGLILEYDILKKFEELDGARLKEIKAESQLDLKQKEIWRVQRSLQMGWRRMPNGRFNAMYCLLLSYKIRMFQESMFEKRWFETNNDSCEPAIWVESKCG